MDKDALYQRLDLVAPSPYSRSEYLRRAVWAFVYLTCFRISPIRAFKWRRWLLTCCGAKIGHGSQIRRSARIRHPWLLEFAEHVTIGDRVEIYNLGPLTIGKHTTISQNAHLCGGTHDIRRRDLQLIRSTICIGSGVWVCADAFVGPGVTIGDNAIVGACAVVTHDVPQTMIVAGNPAVVIRERPRPTA